MSPLRTAALLLALAGCGGPRDSATSSPTGTPSGTAAPALPDPTATQSEVIRAVWTVTWEPTEGTHHVEVGVDGALTQATPPGDPVAGIPLVGLKPGREITWEAVTTLSDGTELRSGPRTLQTIPPPPELRLPTLASATPDSAIPGSYLVYGQLQPPAQSWLLAVDGDGEVVWWRRGTPGKLVVTSRPSLSGHDLLYAELPLQGDPAETRLVRIAFDGSAESETRLWNGHHDFAERGDGTIAYLQFDFDGQGAVGDAVVEVPEGAVDGSGARQIWSWIDDYPVDPWYVCEHTLGWAFDPSISDWTHSNSLVPHPDGEHDLVMSKFHDAVLKIRRSDGQLVWQLGGEYGDVTLPDGSPGWTGLGATAWFSHGHFSDAYPAPAGSGFDLCLAVFDNGYHYEPLRSGLVEVCIDEAAKTAETTWRHVDPGGGFTPLMGDLRRLDASWLAAWSDLSRIEELGDDGAPRWRLLLDPLASSGRVRRVVPGAADSGPWLVQKMSR